jgi:hypothetical protein
LALATQPGPESPDPPQQSFLELYRQRVEAENAAARELLQPLAPGERPWPITVSVALTAVAGIANLILYAAGATIAGKHPAPATIYLFSGIMLACSVGMWRLSYLAVLAFMALLAIVIVLFSLFLVEASNLLGLLVPPVFIVVGAFLFWKLIRVLGRLQVPRQSDP